MRIYAFPHTEKAGLSTANLNSIHFFLSTLNSITLFLWNHFFQLSLLYPSKRNCASKIRFVMKTHGYGLCEPLSSKKLVADTLECIANIATKVLNFWISRLRKRCTGWINGKTRRRRSLFWQVEDQNLDHPIDIYLWMRGHPHQHLLQINQIHQLPIMFLSSQRLSTEMLYFHYNFGIFVMCLHRKWLFLSLVWFFGPTTVHKMEKDDKKIKFYTRTPDRNHKTSPVSVSHYDLLIINYNGSTWRALT